MVEAGEGVESTQYTKKSPWDENEAQTGVLGVWTLVVEYQADKAKNAISLGLGLRMGEMACSVIGLSGFLSVLEQLLRMGTLEALPFKTVSSRPVSH